MLASEAIYQILGPIFNDRVGPHPLPEGFDKSLTYITYQGISNEHLIMLDGWTGHGQVRVQVNVYNHDNIQCEKEAIRIAWAMDEQSLISSSIADQVDGGFDTETQLYCQQIDFYMWQNACN